MSVDQAYNFKLINSTVSTAGVLSEDQLKELGSEGYEVVINLLPGDSEYAIEGEASIVEQQNIEYVSIPVDFSAPTENDYQKFAAKLDAIGNRKVMLHCAANYRVSAFYGIYAVRTLGWSADEARGLMDSVWDLSEYPVWNEFVNNNMK